MPLSFRAAALSASLVLLLPLAAPAQENAGAYLAARHAGASTDYRNAATYYTEALIDDPQNVALLESAALSFLALGELDRALPIARSLQPLKPDSQIATVALLLEAAQAGDWDAALAVLDKGADTGPLVDGLARGWVLLGQGKMSDAEAAFDAFAAQPGLGPLGLYHKALAKAVAGDFEGADTILSGEAGTPLRATRRGVIAHAQVLSQLERNPDAVELIDTIGAAEPVLAGLRARLAAGEPLPFDMLRNAADGLAEVFFSVATSLGAEGDPTAVLLYARAAQILRPEQTDAILLSAGLLERQGQFDLATEAYNLVPRDDPAFHIAEMGRASALVKAGKRETAIEVLDQLARSRPDMPEVQVSLGDLLRQEERYAEATAAYDKAIAQFTTPDPEQWPVYFARGITHEREKRWPEAEADLRRALELSPDQPQVLNYLGYSFVEKGENLPEALSMIERAVAARPDDGFITDSLGWVFYRLARYDEAVVQMERAVELEPIDPVVNDHLGDVYWAVGRRLEANFQWRRALSFEPTETDAKRIRQKLAIGLDAVLAEEGAAPLAVSTNGN